MKKLLVMLIILASCTEVKNSNNSKVREIDYQAIKEVEFSSFFDLKEAEFVQLEMSDSLVLSSELIVKCSKGFYFVFDRTSSLFYRFDKNGKCINKIGMPGKSPEEYYALSDFQCDNVNEVVHVLCSAGNEIKKYKFDGCYIETIKLPENIWSFALVQDNSYWLYSCFFSSNHHRLHYFNDGKISKSILPINTKHFGTADINFTVSGSNGLFKEVFFPTIYAYSSDSLFPVVKFNFENNTITESDFERIEDPFLFTDEIAQKGFFAILDVAQNSQNYVANIIFQKGMDVDASLIVIGKANGSAVRLSSNDVNKEFINGLRFFNIDDSGRYYFVTNPQELLSFIGEMDSKNIGSISEDGNPVIIKLKSIK